MWNKENDSHSYTELVVNCKTNRCQAVWGTWVFTGAQGRNFAHGVIAPSAGAHHLSASERACGEETRFFCMHIYKKDYIKETYRRKWRTPLLNDEGLPVFISASGIPTVLWPSFPCVTCFLFLPRLFSWWAVRARATLPSAVANSTFFKFGESFSWENMAWKKGEADVRRPHKAIYETLTYPSLLLCVLWIALSIRNAKLLTVCKAVYLPKCGIQKHWYLGYSHGQRLGDGHRVSLFEWHLRTVNAPNKVSSLLWDQPAHSSLMHRLSSSTPELPLHTRPMSDCRCITL